MSNNQEFMSLEDAVKEQHKIHARLLQEIDDGLEAEAKYQAYYEPQEFISLAEVAQRQLEIHERIKQRMKNAYRAEAEYLAAYYGDDTES